MLKSDDFNKALGQAHEQLQAGSDLEPVLFDLRRKGADKIDSIKIVKAAMQVSTSQAKSLVDLSETWGDRYADDRSFHEVAWDAVRQLKEESKDIEVVIEERSDTPDFE